MDSSGTPHIVYRDEIPRATIHARWNTRTQQFIYQTLLGYDSGTASAIAPLTSGNVLVVTSWRKNAFNNRLRGFILSPSGVVIDRFNVTSPTADPLPKEIRITVANDGRVILTYTQTQPHPASVFSERTREVTHTFASESALRQSAVTEPSGWERHARPYFWRLNISTELPRWYVGAYRADIDQSDINTYANRPMYYHPWMVDHRITVAADYPRWQLEASVLFNSIGESVMSETTRLNHFGFSSTVGLPGGLNGVPLRLKGYYEAIDLQYYAQGPNDQDALTTNHQWGAVLQAGAKFAAIELFYRSYAYRLPIYYLRPASSSSPNRRVGLQGRQVRFHDLGIMVRYSKLEKSIGEKVRDWGLAIDAGVGIGTTIAHFSYDLPYARLYAPGSGILLPFELSMGIFGYRRFYNARGLGLYASLVGRVSGSVVFSEWHRDDSAPAKDYYNDHKDGYSVEQLRVEYGPLLVVGMIW